MVIFEKIHLYLPPFSHTPGFSEKLPNVNTYTYIIFFCKSWTHLGVSWPIFHSSMIVKGRSRCFKHIRFFCWNSKNVCCQALSSSKLAKKKIRHKKNTPKTNCLIEKCCILIGTWNPKQPCFKVDVWWNTHFPCKDLVHHAIDSHALKHLKTGLFRVPGRSQSEITNQTILNYKIGTLRCGFGQPNGGEFHGGIFFKPWDQIPKKSPFHKDIQVNMIDSTCDFLKA